MKIPTEKELTAEIEKQTKGMDELKALHIELGYRKCFTFFYNKMDEL